MSEANQVKANEVSGVNGVNWERSPKDGVKKVAQDYMRLKMISARPEYIGMVRKAKALEFDLRESNRLSVKSAGGGGKALCLPPLHLIKYLKSGKRWNNGRNI